MGPQAGAEAPVSDGHPDVGKELREQVAEVFGVTEPDVFHPDKGRRTGR